MYVCGQTCSEMSLVITLPSGAGHTVDASQSARPIVVAANALGTLTSTWAT